jgi:phosphoribosylglycinamide formyltransferase-1
VARRRVAVLISSGGSNLQALVDAAAAPGAGFEVVLVVSNRSDAFGLVRAERARVPARVIEHARFASRPAFEAEVAAALDEAGTELVCLAGFMRVLTAGFIERYRDQMLNIHPSLLPAFPGLRTHERALAAGVRVHGCTVHLVRPELDDGPILAQGIVPVLPEDDEAKLAARVLEVEHRCYPLALEALAAESPPASCLVLHPLIAAMVERGN